MRAAGCCLWRPPVAAAAARQTAGAGRSPVVFRLPSPQSKHSWCWDSADCACTANACRRQLFDEVGHTDTKTHCEWCGCICCCQLSVSLQVQHIGSGVACTAPGVGKGQEAEGRAGRLEQHLSRRSTQCMWLLPVRVLSPGAGLHMPLFTQESNPTCSHECTLHAGQHRQQPLPTQPPLKPHTHWE